MKTIIWLVVVSMGNWIDYYNSQGASSISSFTGTLQIPTNVVTSSKETILTDPCDETSDRLAVDSSVETNTITMSYGSGEEGSGIFTLQVPEPEEEVVSATNIELALEDYNEITILGRTVTQGIELIGHNQTVCSDPFAKEMFTLDDNGNKEWNNDIYCLSGEREQGTSWNTQYRFGWELMYRMDHPIALYASGLDPFGNIHFFGGAEDNGFAGTGRYYKYNIPNNTLTLVSTNAIPARAGAYGHYEDGQMFVYGGYAVHNTTSTWIGTFYKTTNGSGFTQLPVNMNNVNNKIVGGHGRLYIGNAMSVVTTGQGWNYLGSCYEYSIAGNSWSAPYNGNDYTADLYTNFDSFVFHKGILYYFNEQRLMKILPDQFVTTVGVLFPETTLNPKMVSYGDYIIFGNGISDDQTTTTSDLTWYNTETGFYGTIVSDGYKPQVVYGFDIHVFKDYLYLIGGVPVEGDFSNFIWRINLKEFFDTLDTCGAVPLPPDTYREKTITACKEYVGHPCGEDGTYVRDYNDPYGIFR